MEFFILRCFEFSILVYLDPFNYTKIDHYKFNK